MPLLKLPFRAIALDLDGTLLNSQGVVSAFTIDTLRRISNLGVKIIVASGRMSARIIPHASALDIQMNIVAYNGAETLEGQAETWSILSSQPISPSTRDAVYSLCKVHSVFLNVYSNGKLFGYNSNKNFRYAKIYSAQSGAEYDQFTDRIEDLPQDGIFKLLAIESQANRDKLWAAWNPKLSKHCSIAKSNPEYIEFMGLGVTKAAALKILLHNFNIEADEMLAFGDAENDFEMLSLAGVGIGMANASPGLKRTFTRFSQWTNEEEAVAKELNKIFQP